MLLELLLFESLDFEDDPFFDSDFDSVFELDPEPDPDPDSVFVSDLESDFDSPDSEPLPAAPFDDRLSVT